MEFLYASIFYMALCIGTLAYIWIRRHCSYWSSRGIVSDPPAFFSGNLKEVGRTQALRDVFYEFYMRYKSKVPFGGFYFSMRHAVVLLDLELVKNVLIKDFANFAHRGNYHNVKDDPLSGHLFNLDGPKWRSMRTKLTPTFTTGKMRFMFPTIVDVAEKFVELMNDMHKNEWSDKSFIVEVKDLLGRFTTDVIGTCAFGLECNSLKNPNTEFRLMGKKAFNTRRHGRTVTRLMSAFPDLAKKLSLINHPEDVITFFMNVVRETVEYRERENIQRNDFMNLLIELKNNKNSTESLTLEEIVAQAFVFFLAGFETSSSTMGFFLYEMAMNQDIQDRVRLEIAEILKRHDGVLTYEATHELKYLKQCLNETMRMYSVASIILRKTVNNYPVPDSNLVIEKGIMVIIPVDAIHRDPDIYPDPETYNPDRFAPHHIETRHPMSFLPFGEGPRNCIGLRFGEMQAIIGLTYLLRNFRFSPAPNTQKPLTIDKRAFILSSEGGIMLKVEKV